MTDIPPEKAKKFVDRLLSRGFQIPPSSNRKAKSLIIDNLLNDEDVVAAKKRAWDEEFGTDPQTISDGGSLCQFFFLWSLYIGEKRLEKLGQLEWFRRSKKLSDYQEAEDSVKRGWLRFNELELGIKPEQDKDKLKIRQFQLIDCIRSSAPDSERQQWLRSHGMTCLLSAEHGDLDFFRRLGRALGDSPRKQQGDNDFAQVLLFKWLTRFWWLMESKTVADDFAQIQGDELLAKYDQRLRKLKSRPGWKGCFHSSCPPLVDHIQPAGRPKFTPRGQRLLRIK